MNFQSNLGEFLENEIIYSTPVVKIGKHEWRMIVYPTIYYGNCTMYQFRGIIELSDGIIFRDKWENETNWPKYDSDNGATAGLPKTLSRLYYRYEKEIEKALGEKE
jgi:hypothetical protein